MTTVDVLLPVLDARRTVPFALRDVLRQQGVRVRVLAVVDVRADGRDDGSRVWLHAAARDEPRLRVLDGEGRGAGAALDRALAAARAPLVAHMEADDRCPPDRLARLAAALHADRSLSAVTSRVGQVGARSPGMARYLAWQNGLLDHDAMARERFVEIPALHQTGLYRREALERVGGYAPGGPWPPDIDFWLRWFERDLRVAKLPRVLYRWRQHPRQATRRGPRHTLAALRAAKVAALRRLLDGRPVVLVSTGATLRAWRDELRAAGIAPRACVAWRPGEGPPEPSGDALLLAAYGSARVRARLRAALPGVPEPEGLLFTA